MKLRIARQMSHSTRTNRFLRWSRNAFLVVGVLALGYSGFVLLDTKLTRPIKPAGFSNN